MHCLCASEGGKNGSGERAHRYNVEGSELGQSPHNVFRKICNKLKSHIRFNPETKASLGR